MSWGYTFVELACGCAGNGQWDVDWPGDEQKCERHGSTSIERISRVRETRGSRDFQLGVKVSPE